MSFPDIPHPSMLRHAPEDTPNNPKNTFCAEATPQLYNHNAWLDRFFAGHHLSAPESSRPGTCVGIPQGYLSLFPGTSSLSYPLPFTSHSPLTHLRLRGNVRPLLHQEKHDRIMPLPRSSVERRLSILRRAPTRQQPTPALHRSPAHVHPCVFKPPLSRNPTAPGPGGLFCLRVRGARYSQPSQTRRGACLLQENGNSRTGKPGEQPFLECL